MLTEAQMFALLTIGGSALGVVIWYLIRRGDIRLDKERDERTRQLESERNGRENAAHRDRELFVNLFERASAAWMSALEKERESAKVDRHEFRNELSKWAGALNSYKLEAAEKFVQQRGLENALQPLKDAVEGIRADQREIFDRLHDKQDRG